MPKNTPVHNYLSKLGLEADTADVYLALYTHGPQHISALARLAGLERTRIYRLLDKLAKANLIEGRNAQQAAYFTRRAYYESANTAG